MFGKVTDELKVLFETGVLQHSECIATHGENLAGFHEVVFVQKKAVCLVFAGASVNHCLAVVFTRSFQIGQLEQSVGADMFSHRIASKSRR